MSTKRRQISPLLHDYTVEYACTGVCVVDFRVGTSQNSRARLWTE